MIQVIDINICDKVYLLSKSGLHQYTILNKQIETPGIRLDATRCSLCLDTLQSVRYTEQYVLDQYFRFYKTRLGSLVGGLA